MELNTSHFANGATGAALAAWITLRTLSVKSDWSWRRVSLIPVLEIHEEAFKTTVAFIAVETKPIHHF